MFRKFRGKFCLATTAIWCVVMIIINTWSPFKDNSADATVKPETVQPREDLLALKPRNEKAVRTTETFETTETFKTAEDSASLSPRKFETSTSGRLNLHSWIACGFEVQTLKQWPLFPEFPDQKSSLAGNFSMEFKESDVGKRLFGYLCPAATGGYRFAISSDDTSELWLSSNEDPGNARLIARVYSDAGIAWTKPGEYKKYPTQISDEIFLTGGRRYFVDCLLKNGVNTGHVSVAWQPPGLGDLTVISGQFFAPYCDEDDSKGGDCIKQLRTFNHFKQTFPTPPEPTMHRFPQHGLSQKDLEGVLPLGAYYPPSYTRRYNTITLKKVVSLLLSEHTSVYPEDRVKLQPGSDFLSSNREFEPNRVLPQLMVNVFVNQVMSALAKKHDKRFSLNQILSVQGNQHESHGSRYLVDLKLYDNHEKKYSRLTEYINRDSSGLLSFVENLTWRRTATINFIVPVKDNYPWMTYLVKEMTKLYALTKDEHFRLVIVDFESTDGDINSLLKDSPISEKYTLINMAGSFNWTLAIERGANSVADPDSIVFLFDLHVTVPVTLLESIRKHTIQNMTVFLPIAARLDCGSTITVPKGRWEETSSRFISIYKSDWKRFNGVTDILGNTWGGEDWLLLKRILDAGMEIVRFKSPGLYHLHL